MPRKSPPGQISKDVLAQYLTAELDSLTQRALQQENALTNKINFYLVTVTAVGGGLILASGVPSLRNVILPLSGLIALIFHIMGWVTLSQGLDLRAGSTIFYRRMGRIRQWFLDHDSSLLPYLPFMPGDNRPLFYVPYAPIRSIESILLLVNSITAGTLGSLSWLFACFDIFHLTFPSEVFLILVGLGIGVLVSVMIWFLQVRYIRKFMLNREKWETDFGRVNFPYD